MPVVVAAAVVAVVPAVVIVVDIILVVAVAAATPVVGVRVAEGERMFSSQYRSRHHRQESVQSHGPATASPRYSEATCECLSWKKSTSKIKQA